MLCDIIPEPQARAKRNKRGKLGELVYHVTCSGLGAVGQIGKPISRKKALKIGRRVIKQAERERRESA